MVLNPDTEAFQSCIVLLSEFESSRFSYYASRDCCHQLNVYLEELKALEGNAEAST